MTAWDQAREVLAVRLDALGDLLMTTPAIRALKESLPGRRVTALTSTAAARAVPLIAELDGCIPYDAPWIKACQREGRPEREEALVRRVRAQRFQAAVIFTVYTQSSLPAALLCHLAGIPLRLAHCRENPYGLLTDWVRETEPQERLRHEVRRQLDLVASVGCRTANERLSVRVSASARERVSRALASLGISRGTPFVALHPGASAPSRRYPAAQFAQAAGLLSRRTRLPLAFTGSECEASEIDGIVASVRGGAPVLSLAGRLSLEELAALIAAARVLVCNNTGPAHMAAAVGTPVVDLYALTNPQHTPWEVPSRVLYFDVPCKFCYKSVCPELHHDCLRRVPPEAVVEAACALLEARP